MKLFESPVVLGVLREYYQRTEEAMKYRNETGLLWPDDLDVDLEADDGLCDCCPRCGGLGYVMTCVVGVGADECIHGDGEDPCPVCYGD